MSNLTEIQSIQTAHRWRLVEAWSIPVGSRILEIGCGQGDMTAVLAEHVGPNGSVVAIDLAKPDYGSPETLGQATQKILDSPVGNRVKFHFERDVRDGGFSPGEFDVVVMAHCSWYFDSTKDLLESLKAIQPLAPSLAFAEWYLVPYINGQLAHYLAVQIQALVQALKAKSKANIRTPLSLGQLYDLLSQSGWIVGVEKLVDSPDLQDADWEIYHVLQASKREADEMKVPAKVQSLIESQLEVLATIALPKENRPLSVYAVTATSRDIGMQKSTHIP